MCDELMCRQLDDLQRKIYMMRERERERERESYVKKKKKKHRINDCMRNILSLV